MGHAREDEEYERGRQWIGQQAYKLQPGSSFSNISIEIEIIAAVERPVPARA